MGIVISMIHYLNNDSVLHKAIDRCGYRTHPLVNLGVVWGIPDPATRLSYIFQVKILSLNILVRTGHNNTKMNDIISGICRGNWDTVVENQFEQFYL